MDNTQNPQDPYIGTLLAMTIDQLVAELQQVHDQLDMVLTMNNSLDGADITEGGGAPADQERYQSLIRHQKQVTEEVNKRHILDMLK